MFTYLFKVAKFTSFMGCLRWRQGFLESVFCSLLDSILPFIGAGNSIKNYFRVAIIAKKGCQCWRQGFWESVLKLLTDSLFTFHLCWQPTSSLEEVI